MDPRSREFAAGMGAAIISITVTYPVTKLIYRQILENAELSHSLNKIHKEGIKFLYRGLGPPMIQRGTELSLMFGVYKSAQMAIRPLHLDQYQERLVSSVISGAVAASFTPLERIQMLLIDSKNHHRFRNMFHVAYVIGTEYGIKEYYRGFTAITARNCSQNIFFFTVKDKLYDYLNHHSILNRALENFLVGSFLGFTMAAIFYPLKVIKTQMQHKLGGEFTSMMQTVKNVYARDQKGIMNFYRGVVLNIGRSGLSWGVTNLSYEFLRNHL